MAHTPGPWSWGSMGRLENLSGDVVVKVIDRLMEPEDLSLIAAAPELAEALREVLPFIGHGFVAAQVKRRA